MKISALMTGIALVALNATAAPAAELPTFEVAGFPISPHQVAVMGSRNVEEQAAVASLTSGGMPASPLQLMVLAPRHRVIEQVAIAVPDTVGSSTR